MTRIWRQINRRGRPWPRRSRDLRRENNRVCRVYRYTTSGRRYWTSAYSKPRFAQSTRYNCRVRLVFSRLAQRGNKANYRNRYFSHINLLWLDWVYSRLQIT